MAVKPLVCKLCHRVFGVVNVEAAKSAPSFCSHCLRTSERAAIATFQRPASIKSATEKHHA